jgi:hypothetical protein
MNTGLDNLNYLQGAITGLTYFERDKVHYTIVGGASVHIDETTWRSMVDSALQSVMASREVAK